MNFNRNFNPRQIKARKELLERLDCQCTSCGDTNSQSVIGQLDEEVTIRCTSCGNVYEITYLLE